MCIQGKTVYPTLKGWKLGYLVLHRKRLEPRVLPWQQLRKCHFFPSLTHISGAKFDEHCSNISRDLVDWVLYCFGGTIYDVITFLICIIQKHNYLYHEKKIFQKGKHHSSLLWKTFQISNNYFLLHRHFKFHMFIQVKKFKLCCSRNYPYPSHKGILGWNPIPLEILVSVIILSSIKFF